jgi:hypothetical protein
MQIRLGIIILLLISCFTTKAQVENVIVETYYIADNNDIADTLGGTLAAGSKTYRIFIDLKEGSVLKKVYGDQFHPLLFRTSTTFYNHKTEGKSFAKDFNKNRFEENTVALDSWLTIGQISNSSTTLHGILKTDDTNGSFIGGVNNDSLLLSNTSPDLGIPLTVADGIINYNLQLTNWGSNGIVDPVTTLDSTIFGSLQTGNEFLSYDASIQNSGTIGVNPADNKILIAQLTTSGELSFKLNIEVEIPNPSGGVFLVKYVSDNDTLFDDEQLSPYLSYPFLCGCRDANFLEYSNIYACDFQDSCKTPIILGCMDTSACNFNPRANFNVSSLCCYPGYCNDRDIAVVCPEFMIGLRFYIYPNPTDNILNLNFWLQESADVFYSIVSFLGNEVKTETQIGNFNGNQNLTIDVSSLEKGIYYIKLRAGNAEQRKIFIKN